MWRSPVTTAAAAGEPLSPTDAKAHLRVDHDTDDALIGDYIAASRGHVESVTGTRLVTQTVVVRTDDWSDLSDLPIAPVQSVTSVAYVDTDGESQTLSTDVYEARLYGLEPGLALKHGQVWPQAQDGSLVTVTLVVGYGDAGAQPPEAIHAIRLILGDLYENREPAEATMTTIHALLANHKKHLI